MTGIEVLDLTGLLLNDHDAHCGQNRLAIVVHNVLIELHYGLGQWQLDAFG